MRRRRVIVQRAELAREGDVLVRRPVDAAEDDHMVRMPDRTDRRDVRIAEPARRIDAADFRAQRKGQRNYVYGHCGARRRII